LATHRAVLVECSALPSATPWCRCPWTAPSPWPRWWIGSHPS